MLVGAGRYKYSLLSLWPHTAGKPGAVDLPEATAEVLVTGKSTKGVAAMAIRDQILQAANEIAGRMQADLFDLDRRLAEAKKHVAKIEMECDAARGAPERLSNFPIQLGSNYLCPRCWIEEGRRSPLNPAPSNTRRGLLHCGFCQFELLISH